MNVELRMRVSASMSGKNFTAWNPVFLHTARDNYLSFVHMHVEVIGWYV